MSDSPHIHEGEAHWLMICRMHEGKRQILANKQDKFMIFPSQDAAMQFMKAEEWSETDIREVWFQPLEEDK